MEFLKLAPGLLAKVFDSLTGYFVEAQPQCDEGWEVGIRDGFKALISHILLRV
jgi:hypothetical protein